MMMMDGGGVMMRSYMRTSREKWPVLWLREIALKY